MDNSEHRLYCLIDRGTSGDIFVLVRDRYKQTPLQLKLGNEISPLKESGDGLLLRLKQIRLYCLIDRGTSGDIFVLVRV